MACAWIFLAWERIGLARDIDGGNQDSNFTLNGSQAVSDAATGPLVDHAQRMGASELAVPRKIVRVPELPTLGTGKTDYVAVQRLAELELANAA